MNRRKRTSYQLSHLKSELRNRALIEEDEEKRKDYWRLHYKAKNAEHEVREMVMDAELRRLIDFIVADGRYGDFPVDDEKPEEKPKSPPPADDIDEDDIPPRQKGLWD